MKMTNIHAAFFTASVLASTFTQASPLNDSLIDATTMYIYEANNANLAKVNALLKKGAQPHSVKEPVTAFQEALDAKNKTLVELFLKKQKIQLNGPLTEGSDQTALLRTVSTRGTDKPKDTADVVQLLLAAGAKPDFRMSPEIPTPLLVVTSGTVHDAILQDTVTLLLNAGADPKAKSNNNFTTLTGLAASDLNTLEQLLAKGADPYAVTDVGSTPLHFVCARGTAAAGKPDPTAAQRISKLLKPGSSIDAFYPQIQPHPIGTPLNEALSSQNPDCVRALLAAGAKPTALAYPESFAKLDPAVKGKTVRQMAKEGLRDYPDTYSKAVVDLLAK